MNIFAITGLFVAISSAALSIFTFLRGRERIHLIWGIFCFSVALWGFGIYKIATAKNVEEAIFSWRIAEVGVIFIPVLLTHFVIKFLNLNRKWFLSIFYFLTFIFLYFNIFTHYFINQVRFVFNQFYYISPPTILYTLFVFMFLGVAVYNIIQLWQVYKKKSGVVKLQIKYLILAFCVGFSGGASSFLPVYYIDIYPILNVTIFLSALIVAYTIFKHRLMDIKFVLRKSSVYLASLATILILVGMVKYAVIRFFIDIYNWVDFIILILAIMIFLPIRNYYYKIANKYFFTSMYDSRKVIGKLSDKLRSTLELKRIYGHISDVLFDTFHVKAMGILIRDKKDEEINRAKSGGEDRYIVRYNKGFNIGGRKKFPGNKKLCNLFLKHNKSIVVEEIKSANYKEFKGTIDLLTSFGAAVVTPLNIKGEVIGLIILGQKESGDMYNDQDLRVLEIMGAQAAIAIENAVLYEAAKNFNVKLKKEVKKATAQMRSANEKLKKLDSAKSEFISIASHQLRTPLTIIKGYISMLLEGSFGRLNEKEKEPLTKVYESNERLIQLVEDLLDISRIESGRLQFNFKEMRLEEITDSVVEELTNSAKSKGLDLIYKKPAQPLPKVKIDEEKIRQVVINLIDNAIKYTGRGSVAVSMDKIDGGVYFCVADTGAGISEEDLPALFKKFSRGKATSLIDANGVGLGLYVGKMMIEAHHGKIWAESGGRDKGAKFCFTLPAGKVK